MKSKVLLQINVTANWGSTGKIAEDIGKLAIENGWESWIAYGRGNPLSASNLIRIGSDWDMKVHALKSRIQDNHGLSSKITTKRFIKQIEEIKPDIIHLHNIHGYYLNYPILFEYLKKWGGPVIWTLHDIWPITGHCAYFGIEECTKWKTGCNNCPRLDTYPKSIFFDNSENNYNLKKEIFTSLSNITLIPVSNWLSDLLAQSFLRNIPKQTIHNGVDVSVFKPYEEGNGNYIIGVASIWEDRKGLTDFHKLRKILPADIGILLVGLSEDQIQNLPSGIKGIERTTSKEKLASLYSSAIALVNPTYEDNFPTVNIEALASGTPVITYNTGGSSEAIDSNTGFVVKKGDIAGLANSIVNLYNLDLISRKKMCRERAIELFASDKKYTEYIELYKLLTNINGGVCDMCIKYLD